MGFVAIGVQNKRIEWQSIVPFMTTRTEVEAEFGAPRSGKTTSGYKTQRMKVTTLMNFFLRRAIPTKGSREVKAYLVSRGVDKERITIADGGYRERWMIQVFVVFKN